MGRIGMGELILVLVIALVVFGPSKLPDIGKAVGKGLREFKNATKGLILTRQPQAKARRSNGWTPVDGLFLGLGGCIWLRGSSRLKALSRA